MFSCDITATNIKANVIFQKNIHITPLDSAENTSSSAQREVYYMPY